MTTTLKDAKLYLAGFDLSGDHNQLQVNLTKDAPQDTRFGMDSRSFLPDGLRHMMADHAGMFDGDAGGIDDTLWTQYTASGLAVMTFAAAGNAELDVAYSFQGVTADYSPFPGDSVGDPHTFEAHAEASGDAVRGLLHEIGATARSSSGNSTGSQQGDIAAGEIGIGALHVVAKTGSPTLDVDIESDDNSGFTSETVRGSFAQATDVGAEWITIDPAITDDWWRIAWTFGGTGSITFVVNFGIQ